MGSFSNSDEGYGFVAEFCERCVHWKDEEDGRGPGCPVMDGHLLWAYGAKGELKGLLDLLIKPREAERPQECLMYQPESEAHEAERRGQDRLWPREG